MKTKCDKCKRQSDETDGWQELHNYKTDPKVVTHYCPSCWKTFCLKQQREAIIEELEKIPLGHNDPAMYQGMSVMKNWCIIAVKNFDFET
jgi:hypothetical protein